MEKPTTREILSKLALIHCQREHLLLITMVLLFFQSDFPVQSYELLNVNNTQVDFDHMPVLIMHVISEHVGLPVRYTVEQ